MKSVVTLRYMTETDREGELGESISKEACGDKGSDMKLNQTTPPTMTEQILRRKMFFTCILRAHFRACTLTFT